MEPATGLSWLSHNPLRGAESSRRPPANRRASATAAEHAPGRASLSGGLEGHGAGGQGLAHRAGATNGAGEDTSTHEGGPLKFSIG